MSLSIQKLFPLFADELSQLLAAAGRDDLARQVPDLVIVDRCRCGDDFCATFYTQPKPKGAYGSGHQNVVLEPEHGMLILDVVHDTIACVEVLNRDEIRRELMAALP